MLWGVAVSESQGGRSALVAYMAYGCFFFIISCVSLSLSSSLSLVSGSYSLLLAAAFCAFVLGCFLLSSEIGDRRLHPHPFSLLGLLQLLAGCHLAGWLAGYKEGSLAWRSLLSSRKALATKYGGIRNTKAAAMPFGSAGGKPSASSPYLTRYAANLERGSSHELLEAQPEPIRQVLFLSGRPCGPPRPRPPRPPPPTTPRPPPG